MHLSQHQSLPESVDVLIVGAGAAGLMCAAIAGQRGRNVLVIDHANKVGKKILMSGGGRCNFTNINTHADNFISRNPNFCKSALARYTPYDFISLVDKHNIPYHEKKLGQLFCDNKSKDILNMLLSECRQANVKIQTKCHVSTIHYFGAIYHLNTTHGAIKCHSLVIATGGLSIPSMGASGFGYRVAQQFNIDVLPTQAALVPFKAQHNVLDKIRGLSGSSVEVSARCSNTKFQENLLFTHRGISGPAILQISSYWQDNQAVIIDFLPNTDLFAILKNEKYNQSKTLLKNILARYLSKNIGMALLDLGFPDTNICDKAINQCSDYDLAEISRHFHSWQFIPTGTEGYRTAEVTLGGVNCKEISSKTMQSNKQSGLYFIGEVLDVTGHLGGYNFQWAWSSAVAAGKAV